MDFRFCKLNEEKRLVTAWASVVSKADGTPIEDHQGDVIDIDDLEIAAIEAFAKGGAGKSGDMHETVGGAHVVQHFTFSKQELAAVKAFDGEGLLVKVFVEDESLWERVKSGALPEMSIAGAGMREPING